MSYDLTILVPPVPADDARAWDRFHALRAAEEDAAPLQEAPRRPEVLQILHDRLTARYPCICDLSDDEVDDGVWSDGPLINNFGERAATLAMRFGAAEQVVPFVIEQATALGLVVFDPQTNLIHRRGVDSSNPASSSEPTAQSKPWWRFWK